MEREVIEIFKAWCKVKGGIYYVGPMKNANKQAKVLPIFQRFVKDTAMFWALHFNYSLRGAKPGPLAPMYAMFRDNILLQALTELRDEMVVEAHNLPPIRYVMKHSSRLRDKQPTPRAIYEWVAVQEAVEAAVEAAVAVQDAEEAAVEAAEEAAEEATEAAEEEAEEEAEEKDAEEKEAAATLVSLLSR